MHFRAKFVLVLKCIQLIERGAAASFKSATGFLHSVVRLVTHTTAPVKSSTRYTTADTVLETDAYESVTCVYVHNTPFTRRTPRGISVSESLCTMSRPTTLQRGAWRRLLRTLTVAKGNPDIVVFADDTSIDNSIPVAGHESDVTRDACETGHVVDCSAVWRSHHQLVRWYLTTT